jgi:hypothetical protein
MASGPALLRRFTHGRGLGALVVALILAGTGAISFVWRTRRPSGQAMRIDGDLPYADAPWPTASLKAKSGGHPYVTSVSPSGRYFLDQYGKPILVKGDSPWALMTRVSPTEAKFWFTDREKRGFNAAIISLVGAIGNGGPSSDGSTFDGLRPFVNGDVLMWQEPYWQRVMTYLRMAADHGITVMLYPIDGWTIGNSFVPKSFAQCNEYGRKVAEYFRDLPNIVWMSGGDYIPATKDLRRGSDVDHCIDAMMRGIRESGDGRPFSMQLAGEKSISNDNPYWADRIDWNFVYTYYPTYRAVLEAYGRHPRIPAVMGEANYEGENNQPDSLPTTNQTLRRQVLWALTSGAAGEFVGSHDWTFNAGWERRLSTPAVTQIAKLRNLVSELPWWQLEPDKEHTLVTGGRGTELTTDIPVDVLDNDYATAAKTPDGSVAVLYLPTSRMISVNRAALPADSQAVWIDPTSGQSQPIHLMPQLTTPGNNAGGDSDWILLLLSSHHLMPGGR